MFIGLIKPTLFFKVSCGLLQVLRYGVPQVKSRRNCRCYLYCYSTRPFLKEFTAHKVTNFWGIEPCAGSSSIGSQHAKTGTKIKGSACLPYRERGWTTGMRHNKHACSKSKRAAVSGNGVSHAQHGRAFPLKISPNPQHGDSTGQNG